jgi:Fe-S cluster assembly protein SufD
MSGFDTLLAKQNSKLALDAQALGLPTKRVESWKYVPTRALTRTSWVEATPRSASGFSLTAGRFMGAPKSLQVENATLTETESARLDALYHAQGFALTHGALESECLVLRVAKTDTQTLSLTRLANQASEAGFATLVIRVETGAQLTLLETFEHSMASDANLDSLCILWMLERDASGTHVRYQAANESAHTFTSIDVQTAENARYIMQSVDFGSKLARTDIQVTLGGRGANTELHGLAVTNGSQYHDTHLSVDHAVGDTQSAMAFRTMVDGKGEATFNGRVLIRKDAQRSATEQSVANLLLSETGRINPKPELEIYADDVTASHGCTVGNLNQTELFYLRSRGLSEADAKAFLQYAFAEKIIEEITDAGIREQVEARLLGELKHGELIAELKESVDV